MNNTIIFVVFAIVIYLYFFMYKKESMTNVSIEQQNIIDKLYDFINNHPNAKFSDYINFLSSIKNTNLHIIDNEVFVTFKSLKKRNSFKKQDIIDEMKLK